MYPTMQVMKWYLLVSQMHFPQLTCFCCASCYIDFLNLCDLHPYVVSTLAKTTKDIHYQLVNKVRILLEGLWPY
jgi:hypothetical protein